MHAAGCFPADPITLRTSVETIGSVVLRRAYPDAPVSNLFYDNRREDLAFEKADGRSASRRHDDRARHFLRLRDHQYLVRQASSNAFTINHPQV
jgi:hypothetical protein